MNKIDFDAQYTLGLYADYLGCASVILKHKEKDGQIFSEVIRDTFFKRVSNKSILDLIDFKDEYGHQHYFMNTFINNLNSLEKMITSQSVYLRDINMSDAIFKTTCLFNDGLLSVVDEIKESFLTNLNSFNPNDEKINHRVMALFLALEGIESYCYL
jgi:hypothetical protein